MRCLLYAQHGERDTIRTQYLVTHFPHALEEIELYRALAELYRLCTVEQHERDVSVGASCVVLMKVLGKPPRILNGAVIGELHHEGRTRTLLEELRRPLAHSVPLIHGVLYFRDRRECRLACAWVREPPAYDLIG